MKKGLRRSDAVPIILLSLTWLFILIIWGINVLPPAMPPQPELETAKIKNEIQEAGLEPREASHYRILPDDRGEK
jgi:hypothetical protein